MYVVTNGEGWVYWFEDEDGELVNTFDEVDDAYRAVAHKAAVDSVAFNDFPACYYSLQSVEHERGNS